MKSVIILICFATIIRAMEKHNNEQNKERITELLKKKSHEKSEKCGTKKSVKEQIRDSSPVFDRVKKQGIITSQIYTETYPRGSITQNNGS